MSVGCPISCKKTNSAVARFNAVSALILVIISLFWVNPWIPAFLTIDFFILGFLQKPSPRTFISKAVNFLLKKGRTINAGPKIFAAKIGFWASLAIAIAACFEVQSAYYAFGGILALAASLEAVFEFCLGCKIYPHWYGISQLLKSLSKKK